MVVCICLFLCLLVLVWFILVVVGSFCFVLLEVFWLVDLIAVGFFSILFFSFSIV